MAELTFLRAELVALLFEALLFGCFSILYPISLWMLLYKHRRRHRGYTRLGLWLLGMVTVMYLLSMAHLVLIAVTYIVAFSDRCTTPDRPCPFLVSWSYGTTIASLCLLAAVSLVGDIFMTYRVFIAWSTSWKSIVLPTALILGTLGEWQVHEHNAAVTDSPLPPVTIGLEAFQNTIGPLNNLQSYYAGAMPGLVTTYLALVLATNISHMALIFGRLAWHDRMVRLYHVKTQGPSTHWRAARTILQSEAVYSATVLAALVLHLTRSLIFLVAVNMLPPLVGISFTLIITHVGFYDIKDQLDQANGVEGEVSLRFAAIDHSAKESSRIFAAPTMSTCSTISRDGHAALDETALQGPSAPTESDGANTTPATPCVSGLHG